MVAYIEGTIQRSEGAHVVVKDVTCNEVCALGVLYIAVDTIVAL